MRLLLKNTYTKNIAIKTLLLISSLILISSIVFYFIQQKQMPVRSDLFIPHDNILLKRPELYNAIEAKLNLKNCISTVVLVGMGGAGKTIFSISLRKIT
jgi:Na+/H+ antiporter NhaD/arsenite permease-like protein